MELNIRELLVGNYMSEYPISVKPEVSLRKVIEFMADKRFATLIVMEEDGTVPLGMITEREIIRQVASGKGLESKVRDVLLRQFVSVTPDTTVLAAAKIMISKSQGSWCSQMGTSLSARSLPLTC